MAHHPLHSSCARLLRRAAGTALLLALLPALPATAQDGSNAPQDLRTPAEESGFSEYTSYDDMMDYLVELRARSDQFRMGTYGETRDGRALPYLVFSRPAVTRGWEAAALGKPVVELHANVHGGERTLRESLLILIREMATPGTPENAFLDDMVIVVAPQINPDGFEATPRGTRGNAWGIDLNRDYMKLDHPSIQNWVQNVLHEWNPHVFVDGHNGGQFPYNVKYQCPGHADPDQSLTAICDEGIFPQVDARLEAEGYQAFFWASGNEDGWRGGQTDARISRNYAGFANSIGILFESPGWQDMDVGVPSGRLAYLGVLDYVRDNPEHVISTVNAARIDAIRLGSEPSGDVAVDMDVEAEDFTVDFQIGQMVDGERQVIDVSDAPIIKRPVATATRTRPYAYILPRDAEEAVEFLRRHNITVERLEQSVTLDVEAYEIEGVSWGQAYNHRGAPQLQIGDVHTIEQTFPRGSFVVPTGQMMGRIATHLLEPETPDNLIYWGYMSRWLPMAQLHADSDNPVFVPIWKVMEPTAFPAMIVRD